MSTLPSPFAIWSKTYLAKSAKTPTLNSHIRINEPKFYASYEREQKPPDMQCLLQHAYGTIWRKEHNAYIMKRKKNETYFFKSDPLAKVRAANKAKIEKEQKLKEEQERIAARLKGVKRRIPKDFEK